MIKYFSPHTLISKHLCKRTYIYFLFVNEWEIKVKETKSMYHSFTIQLRECHPSYFIITSPINTNLQSTRYLGLMSNT